MAKGTIHGRFSRRYKSLSEKLSSYSSAPTKRGCILWLGWTSPGGYGACGHGGKVQGAHRLAWIETNGPIPHGMHVLHECDVRNCINPVHLRLGSNADNMADKVARGRAHRLQGSANAQAKLTEAQAKAIRQDRRLLREIAADYGVSQTIVSGIRNGTKWRHI